MHPIGSPTKDSKPSSSLHGESAADVQSLHERQREDQEDEDMLSVTSSDADKAWNGVAGGLEVEDLTGIGFESDIERLDEDPESENEEPGSEEVDDENSDDEMEFTEY